VLVLALGLATAGTALANLLFGWDAGGAGFGFALTSLRAWFLLVLGLVSSLAAWYRFGYQDHQARASARWLPLFLVSMVGVAAANTVWVFMMGWEAMALTSFFLVIADVARPGALRAGFVYLVMSQASALAVLAGFLLMAAHLHSLAFSVWAHQAHTLPLGVKDWVFVLLGLGFAIKSGMVPFHVWLPRAHPLAPAPASALMSGAMIKLGVLGVVQFLLLDLGAMPVVSALALLVVGAAASLLGVLYALMEHDLKRLLAYHSIENMGIIFLGLGTAAVGLDLHEALLVTVGLVAALFHTLNHALFKSQLFLAAGAVEQHEGTLDADALGGLIRTMPAVAALFLAGSLAISGLPPFNGFLSEWLTLSGLLALGHAGGGVWPLIGLGAAMVLGLTGGLAAMCFVKAPGVIFLGQPRMSLPRRPVPASMIWPMGALAALSLALGLMPGPVLRVLGALSPAAGVGLLPPMIPGSVPVTGLVLLLLAGLLVLLARVGTTPEVPRWACGRTAEPAMQFTSSSFTKAVRTTFAVIYRPHRQLLHVGGDADFPDRLIYRGGTTPIWEQHLYRPGYRLLWALSRFTTRLQTGSVRLYLMYLLATVGLMLVLLH
jgi:hydrogenase-4 component B